MVLKQIKQELQILKNKNQVNKKVWQEFWQRLDSGQPLTRAEKKPDHFCAFFVPIHRPTQSIFLVDHIKGDDWMPPGGHIEPDELPLSTVKREFEEELGQSIGSKTIELFNLTTKSIDPPRPNCQYHYDFWYLVWTDKHNFNWDKGEFHNAGWFSIVDGANKIKRNQNYKKAIEQLSNLFK